MIFPQTPPPTTSACWCQEGRRLVWDLGSFCLHLAVGILAQERVLALDRTDLLGAMPHVQVLPQAGLSPALLCACPAHYLWVSPAPWPVTAHVERFWDTVCSVSV